MEEPIFLEGGIVPFYGVNSHGCKSHALSCGVIMKGGGGDVGTSRHARGNVTSWAS